LRKSTQLIYKQQQIKKKRKSIPKLIMRSSTLVSILVSLCTVQSGHAWSTPTGSNANNQQVSRKSVLQTLVQGSVATAAASLLVQQPAWAGEKLASGVTVEVVKAGKGVKPEIGELVAIRFAAYADGRKIDDIFDTPEPYYTRMGSGGLLKGVESTLPLMSLGDRWKLTIPVRKQNKNNELID
jgi:FK506-binding protein 1